MGTYLESIMHTEDELQAEAKRERATRAAVMACLQALDAEYPEFKKSAGPFGDNLAGKIHQLIEKSFNEIHQEEEKELTTLEALKNKYRNKWVR